MLSLSSAKCVVSLFTVSAWKKERDRLRTNLRIGVADTASFVTCVADSSRSTSSYSSVTSAATAITQSAWDQITPQNPQRRRESGSALNVSDVRVAGPLHLVKAGMHSGRMISHCAMTVPNYLLKGTSALCVISATMMMIMRVR